jgi:heme/copper-type cytochrome/quinol oxidase subunit 4
VRSVIVFWFMLVCPGIAWVRLVHIKDYIAELTVAIALSVTLDTIVAETMVLAGRWSQEWGIVILGGLSMLGAVLQMITAMDAPASREMRR